MSEVVYMGFMENEVDGVVLKEYNGIEEPLKHYKKHSDDFAWGYLGSGPADLSISLLADVVGQEVVNQPWVYQQFKEDFVSGWGNVWKITDKEIKRWYSNYLAGISKI